MICRGRSYTAHLLCGAAASAVIVFAGAAQAQEQSGIQIAAQPLSKALGEFASQTKQAVLVTPALTREKVSGPVEGAATPEAALTDMLAGTGLTFRRDGETFLIVQGGSGGPQSAGAGGDVDALIVTAQKREENIQDVPIAISAFSQEDLTRSQVAGGPDLMTQVPNMTFTKTNFSSYSVQIRGIGTQAISATTDPAVAIAFNNTPFVRNRFFEQEFYDLQRIEVLRGPQGTLYGRNATAGVVNIISAKPKFVYEAKVSADVSNYNSTRVEGMVNIPLVEDAVALRLAGAWTKRDGYVTNEITGNPIDGRDLWSTRLSLRFSPSERIDANLIWEHFEENDDRLRSGKQLCNKHVVTEVAGFPVTYDGGFPGAQKVPYQQQLSQGCVPASLYSPDSFQTPNGYQFGYFRPIVAIGAPINLNIDDPYARVVQSDDLRVIESTVDPSYKANTDTVELQVSIDLTDTLSLSSETAWASDFIFSTQDYNRFNTVHNAWEQSNSRPNLLNDGVFCDPQIGCTDRLVVVDLSTARSRHFSQEFRLASDFEGPFNFSFGANFLRYDTTEKYYVFVNSITLWASSGFATKLTTPYEPNVSDNTDCLQRGLDPIDLGNGGGVGTAGHCLYIDPNPIGALNDQGHNYFLSKNPYKLISYAAFGEAYYEIADNLKLTAGLRWTVDKKEAPRIPNWITAEKSGYPVLEVIEQEWRKPTGRLTIDWKPDLAFTDETMVYASFARGYKAGGANPPPAGVALNVTTAGSVPPPSVTHPTSFDAEFVNAFEVGAKNTFLDGRVTMNLAGFYYDYKGYQLSQIVDRSAVTQNFDAEVWGLEIEADWRPLENLRLGFKGGYENTRVADGMQSVDVMDRSDGNRLDYRADGTPFHWIVVKPFPIYPSNCVMPDWLWADYGGFAHQVGNPGGSADGPCDMAYFRGLDPITARPYIENPTAGEFGFGFDTYPAYPNPGYYPGFDPLTAPNNGEGFYKDLSGNELPNAPHFTATITADWSVPLPNDWLATLHTDLYWQSEAWTRIFNMEGYDKLKAYSNINVAAIFTNEEAGWNVMAYVKNVLDRDSITGAFLNSDDTGLTTNVFLTEPRLYGVRVTKEFIGGPLLGSFGARGSGPYPLTVEIGGQVQRHDAPYDPIQPSFIGEFSDTLNTLPQAQNRDLDWGDGRSVRLTWRPDGSLWNISAGVRYGRTNGGGAMQHTEEDGANATCAFPLFYPSPLCDQNSPYYDTKYVWGGTNWTDVTATNREEHNVVDFSVGREAGLGFLGGSRSEVSAGLRYARLQSRTSVSIDGIPDWNVPEGWLFAGYFVDYQPTSHRREAALEAEREFSGTGPVLTWDAAQQLFGDEQVGHVDLAWSVTAGVLFGKQETTVVGDEMSGFFQGGYTPFGVTIGPRPLTGVVNTPVDIRRSNSVSVPVVDLSLGLSYEIQRVRIGAGYRWERYFDVLDAGDDAHQDADRTIDGPYFKIAVGFGG